MNEEAAFLKAIAAHPKERTARLVFADWLQDRDDPRAAWVRDDEIWDWMWSDAKDPAETLAQAAKKGIGNSRDVIVKLGGHAIPAIFAAYNGADSNQKFALGGVLDNIGAAAETALPFLLKAVAGRDQEAQCLALRCLTHLVATNAQARDCVFAALARKEKNVWYAAAWALEHVGPAGAPAMPVLLKRLDDEEAVWPVARALKSIGSPGALPALPTLMRLFTQGSDNVEHWYEVRDAIAALGPDAIGPLLDTAPGTTGDAFADLVGALTDIGPSAVPALKKAAKHKDATTRQAVKEALARLSPEAGADLLRSSDPDEVARTLDHLRMHEKEAVPAIPALIELLADRKQPTNFRESAARILGCVGVAAEPAIPTLIAIFPDAEFNLAQLACCALDELGRTATGTLLWLQRKPPNRRQAGIEASRIRRGMYGGDRQFASRQEVYTIASRVRRPAALVEVVNAAFADDAVEALTAALNDASDDIRLVAALGLWHVATPAAASAITAALKDTNAAVRRQAAQALGLIGAGVPGVADSLETASTDLNWDVQTAAKDALARLTPSTD